MKNRKLIYILLPLVILIWGTIFYKIFFIVPQEEEWTDDITDFKQQAAASAVTDTFSIIAGYRDPFLKNMEYGENPVGGISQPPIKPEPKVEPVIQWPGIVYGGMIKNQQSAKQLALVKINGKESILRAGEMAGVIELIKIYKDSIEVKMGKEKKVIRK